MGIELGNAQPAGFTLEKLPNQLSISGFIFKVAFLIVWLFQFMQLMATLQSRRAFQQLHFSGKWWLAYCFDKATATAPISSKGMA
jgi:hypothetical protein